MTSTTGDGMPSAAMKLGAQHRLRPADLDLSGEDLRGVDLSDRLVRYVSLAGANLDGANLRGARFAFVDLSGATLRGACLEHTHFDGVRATGASFAGSRAGHSFWSTCSLQRADLSGTRLREATLQSCSLAEASLANADLARAHLFQCTLDDAVLSGANLIWANTRGSSFARADLGSARRFFLCREIVAEVLRREVHGDIDRASLIGAILLQPDWCYPEWKAFLEWKPAFRAIALEIFARYPQSGFTEALRRGWRPSPTGIDDGELGDASHGASA